MMSATDSKADRLGRVKERLLNAMMVEIEEGEISKIELLCLMAHVTGMCIAMQDQRKVTPSRAMEVVVQNIEAGNRLAVEQLRIAGGRGGALDSSNS